MSRKKPQPSGKTIPLEELAKQQGVSPVVDLNEVAALWPVDDDPDELLNFILSERHGRRHVRRARKPQVPHGSRRP